MDRKLLKATVYEGFVVVLHYDDGAQIRVDFKPIIARGDGFARLSDPSEFGGAKVSEYSDSLEFPCGLDFCADALYESGEVIAPGRSDLIGTRNA